MLNKTHHIITPQNSWDLSHIYEHLILNSFYNQLLEKSIPPESIGFFHGETFEDVIFFTRSFYHQDAATLFDEIIHNPPIFNTDDLIKAVRVIEAEEKSKINIEDASKTLKDLNNFSRSLKISSRINLVSDHKNFEGGQIKLSWEELSNNEIKVLSRFYVILHDLIAFHLWKNNCYLTQSSDFIYEEEHKIAYHIDFSYHKNTNIKQIIDEITLSIKEYSLNDKYPHLKEFYSRFNNEEVFPDFEVFLYRFTGIISSKQEIVELSTTSSLQSILDKAEIRLT